MLILLNSRFRPCPMHLPLTRLVTTEARYSVNGVLLTVTQVSEVAPESRSVAHWQVLLDWERQRAQPYVIVDPFDPAGLLYFSEVEYKIQCRTLASMNTPFIVVARPGSKRPSSQNSPTSISMKGEVFFEDLNPITWKRLKELRSFISRNVKWSKQDLVRVNDRNIMGLVWLWTRELFHQLGVNSWARRQGQFVGLVRHFQKILRHNGPDFLIQRMKISLFVLYSWLGGNPLKSTHDLGQRVRLTNGLPPWFGRQALRDAKASKGLTAIRLWASLLNMYKYIEGSWQKPTVDTIRYPSFKGDWSTYADFVTGPSGFMDRLVLILKGEFPKFEYKSAHGLRISSAGANYKLAMMSIPADAYAWSLAPVQWVKRWFTLFKDDKMLDLLINSASKFDPSCRGDGSECMSCTCVPRLGRLHPIKEAAGKVRVVAICDYFTQAALKPVHDFLFGILRRLPTDATFDQQGVLDTFAAKGHKEYYSFDLKSATDLIPMRLYEIVMRELLGFKASLIWSMILVDRPFHASHEEFSYEDSPGDTESTVRYTRGQPMGALSSWASLAIVHHVIVQMAAYEAGFTQTTWFDEYVVLGDDICIANERVADCYLDICKRFDITVGIAKSLISREGLLEFASQRILNSHNVSPASLRETLSAQNIPLRKALVERLEHRWGGKSTGLAHLKRILTQPQWSFLSQGGIRGDGAQSLNIVKFLVENPFLLKDVTTDKVISWLGLLDPKLRRLSPSLYQEFDYELRRNLHYSLFESWRRRWNQSRAWFGLVNETFTDYEDHVFDVGPEGQVLTRPPSVPEVSQRLFGLDDYEGYMRYLLISSERSWALTVRNPLGGFYNKLLPWEIHPVRQYGKKYRVPTLYDPANRARLPTVAHLAMLDSELASIPIVKVHSYKNIEEQIFGIFKSLPDQGLNSPRLERKHSPKWKEVKETLRAPLVSLSRTMTTVLGVNLPIDFITGQKTPASLGRMLRRLRFDVMTQWIRRDASPCKREES